MQNPKLQKIHQRQENHHALVVLSDTQQQKGLPNQEALKYQSAVAFWQLNLCLDSRKPLKTFSFFNVEQDAGPFQTCQNRTI